MRPSTASAFLGCCLAVLLLAACGPSAGSPGGRQPSAGASAPGATAASTPAGANPGGGEVQWARGSAHITATGGTVADEDITLTGGYRYPSGDNQLSYGRTSTGNSLAISTSNAKLITIFVHSFDVASRQPNGPNPCTFAVTRNEPNAVAGTFTCTDVHFFAVERNGGDGAVHGTFEASR